MTIMYDTNPSVYSHPFSKEPEGIKIVPMLLINEDGESYPGCPECKTDGYLHDIKNPDEIIQP